MTKEAYVQQFAIQQSTVQYLADQWAVGLQMVYTDNYIAADGKQTRGPIARISVWNDNDQQTPARTLAVHAGSIIDAGRRYRVIEVHIGSSGTAPGTGSDGLLIGLLP